MKKSRILTLLTFFLVMPATLLLGTKLPGRRYYITGTLMILEMMIPFFMAFEGRKPKARELVVIAVMCAIAIVSRVAIPIPHFKAIFAVIMLAGIAFGPEAGFAVGAIAAFASNFFYGQGAYTPWQMFAYGAAGMLSGFLFAKNRLPVKPWIMAIISFLVVLLVVGPLMDCSGIFIMLNNITWAYVGALFAAGFTVNVIQAVSTAVMLMLFGKPLLDILERIKCKYGIYE